MSADPTIQRTRRLYQQRRCLRCGDAPAPKFLLCARCLPAWDYCPVCERVLPDSAFWRNRGKPHGRATECKACADPPTGERAREAERTERLIAAVRERPRARLRTIAAELGMGEQAAAHRLHHAGVRRGLRARQRAAAAKRYRAVAELSTEEIMAREGLPRNAARSLKSKARRWLQREQRKDAQ
jgi:hypothetical protein